MKIYRTTKQVDSKNQILFSLQGLAGIIDGLILFLSFGFLGSSFQINVCKYRTKRFFDIMISRKKKP